MEAKRQSVIENDAIKYITDHDQNAAHNVIKCLERIYGKDPNYAHQKKLRTPQPAQTQLKKYPTSIFKITTLVPNKQTEKDHYRLLLQVRSKNLQKQKDATPKNNIEKPEYHIIEGIRYRKPTKLIAAEKKESDQWNSSIPYSSSSDMKKRLYDNQLRKNGISPISTLIADVARTDRSILRSERHIHSIKKMLYNMHQRIESYRPQLEEAGTIDTNNIEKVVDKMENKHNNTSKQYITLSPKHFKYYNIPQSPKSPISPRVKTTTRHERRASAQIETINYFIEKNAPLTSQEVTELRRKRSKIMMHKDLKPSFVREVGCLTPMKMLSHMTNELKLLESQDTFMSAMSVKSPMNNK